MPLTFADLHLIPQFVVTLGKPTFDKAGSNFDASGEKVF